MNSELVFGRSLFVPGQKLEHYLGIDAALFSAKKDIWKGRIKSGVLLRPDLWDIAERDFDSPLFPKLLCNVFVQYKRPEYVSSANGKEYSRWGGPYFRYSIDPDQQDLLALLESGVSKNSLVTYSCPEFYTRLDLYETYCGNLVQNSNFVKPSRIDGHHIYTFQPKSRRGIAFSESGEIERVEFEREFRALIERGPIFGSNSAFIQGLSDAVLDIVTQLRLTEEYSNVKGYFGETSSDLVDAFSDVAIFCILANVTWAIGYRSER